MEEVPQAVEAQPEPELEMELKVQETEPRMTLPAELRAELGSVIQKPAEKPLMPLPEMYKDLINLIPLNIEEEQVLRKVLKKDDDYKKTVEERLSVLRREIRILRDRWEASEDAEKKKKKPVVVDKMCARCKQPQGILGTIKWWFVSKPRCQRCHLYVCKLCRHKQVNGQWLCALCVRYREVQQLTGEWFARCRGIAGSELVKASLRIMDQNPQWRDQPVVEVPQAPPPPGAPPPPDLPPPRRVSKKRKHGKRKVSRKSTTRIRKKGSKASVRGSISARRPTVTELGRRRSELSRRKSSLGKRKSSMKVGKTESVPAIEPAQAEGTTEEPTEKTETEEGKTNEKKDAGTKPKSPGKKGGSKKAKGKKSGGKGKKKGKGKGNVNVSFATEGNDMWNNNRVAKSSEDSRIDAETTDSVSDFTDNSEDSMPVGTSAAGEERKRRKMAKRISTDSLEKIIAPTSVYFNQSNKQWKHNQEHEMRLRGVVTKSSYDFKSWLGIAYVNMKRHSFCKHDTAQPCKRLSPDLSHRSSSHHVRVPEYSTSVELQVRSSKDSRHKRLQTSSTNHEPTLVSVQGQVQSSSSDKIDELTKTTRQHFTAFSSVRTDRQKKQTINTETYQISNDDLLQLEAQSDMLTYKAASTSSAIKEYMLSLDISKAENGFKKHNRKQAKSLESRKIKMHTEAGELHDDDCIETSNKWLPYPNLSPMSKRISPTSKSQLSSKHRPGKILSRPASNIEVQQPVDSRIEECSKATGNIFLQNLSRSTVLRRLRCPVSYMLEYNESATAPAKPSDSQSIQDLNLNFPQKSKSSKKKKGRKKSGGDKKGKKGKKKTSKSGKGKKGDKKKSTNGDEKKSVTDAAKGTEAADGGEKRDSKSPSGKKKKKSKAGSTSAPKMKLSGLGQDLLMLGSSKTNLANAAPGEYSSYHPPSAAVKMENEQVQTEFKRRGTRCPVCPFCRLFCEYGKENLPY